MNQIDKAKPQPLVISDAKPIDILGLAAAASTVIANVTDAALESGNVGAVLSLAELSAKQKSNVFALEQRIAIEDSAAIVHALVDEYEDLASHTPNYEAVLDLIRADISALLLDPPSTPERETPLATEIRQLEAALQRALDDETAAAAKIAATLTKLLLQSETLTRKAIGYISATELRRICSILIDTMCRHTDVPRLRERLQEAVERWLSDHKATNNAN